MAGFVIAITACLVPFALGAFGLGRARVLVIGAVLAFAWIVATGGAPPGGGGRAPAAVVRHRPRPAALRHLVRRPVAGRALAARTPREPRVAFRPWSGRRSRGDTKSKSSSGTAGCRACTRRGMPC